MNKKEALTAIKEAGRVLARINVTQSDYKALVPISKALAKNIIESCDDDADIKIAWCGPHLGDELILG